MTTNGTPLDLDALLGPQIAENVAKAPVYSFTFGGREWHASESASAAGALFIFDQHGEVDGARAIRYLLSFIVDEEQDDFDKLLAGMRGLDIPALDALTQKIYELVTTRPTEPQSGSPQSPAKKAGARSTAKSSLEVIAAASEG